MAPDDDKIPAQTPPTSGQPEAATGTAEAPPPSQPEGGTGAAETPPPAAPEQAPPEPETEDPAVAEAAAEEKRKADELASMRAHYAEQAKNPESVEAFKAMVRANAHWLLREIQLLQTGWDIDARTAENP